MSEIAFLTCATVWSISFTESRSYSKLELNVKWQAQQNLRGKTNQKEKGKKDRAS